MVKRPRLAYREAEILRISTLRVLENASDAFSATSLAASSIWRF